MEELYYIDSTESLKRFLSENEEAMIEYFYALYENDDSKEITALVYKNKGLTYIFLGSSIFFVGSLLINDNTQLLSFVTGASCLSSFVSLLSGFYEIRSRVKSAEDKAQNLFDELINADETLFKSLERGKFLSDQSVQEIVRQGLCEMIRCHNEDVEKEKGFGR